MVIRVGFVPVQDFNAFPEAVYPERVSLVECFDFGAALGLYDPESANWLSGGVVADGAGSSDGCAMLGKPGEMGVNMSSSKLVTIGFVDEFDQKKHGDIRWCSWFFVLFLGDDRVALFYDRL